jgi:hypothetical protein
MTIDGVRDNKAAGEQGAPDNRVTIIGGKRSWVRWLPGGKPAFDRLIGRIEKSDCKSARKER